MQRAARTIRLFFITGGSEKSGQHAVSAVQMEKYGDSIEENTACCPDAGKQGGQARIDCDSYKIEGTKAPQDHA